MNKQSTLRFSIVIPTYNRNDLLVQCLEHLQIALEDADAGSYEVVVTDDGKTNTAQQLINEKFPWVTWLEGPHAGPAANRNSGVNKAKGEWIIFTDDDCLPQNNWIAAYLHYLDDENFSVLEGKTIADRPQSRYDEVAPLNLEGGKLWSCNFAIRKSLFVSLDGFDETFPHSTMEDIDFYNRLKRASTIKFIDCALVVHPWRQRVAFKHFSKRIKSQKYLANKEGLNSSLKFRWTRFKIFAGTLLFDFKTLWGYSFKGWKAYIDKCIFELCMIFI
jgi:glycosyltransferase involved in cell wall biosynthesis